MNQRLVSLALGLLGTCAIALPQEPPGCTDRTTIRKHLRVQSQDSKTRRPAVLDLRRKKHTATKRAKTRQVEPALFQNPMVATPIYMPQPAPSTATAITESRGFLYVVVGQKIYKVDEKTMRTLQVSQLGKLPDNLASSETDKRHKILASSEDDPLRKASRKKPSRRAD